MTTQELKLTQIRIDGGTQPRVEISEEAVADYAERLREGVSAVTPMTMKRSSQKSSGMGRGLRRSKRWRLIFRGSINRLFTAFCAKARP
jgi:hypothetical protein